MENNITAEELLKSKILEYNKENFVSEEKCKEHYIDLLAFFLGSRTYEAIKETIVEFAKYHVKEALESAAHNVSTITTEEYTGSLGNSEGKLYEKVTSIDRDSILDAYPEDNIE